MIHREPGFYQRFRCLGGDCPLTCCQDWEIVLDEAALADYAAAPSPLKEHIAANLVTDEEGDVCFRLRPDGLCALLDGDGLCPIQRHWGEEHLCEHCGAYPRFVEEYGCLTESCQAVSCPEAARLVLSEGIFPLRQWDDGEESTPFEGVDEALLTGLTAAREKAFSLLAEEVQPIWGRLARLVNFADELQDCIDWGAADELKSRPIPAGRAAAPLSALRGLAVRLLEEMTKLEPLRPQWIALLLRRTEELENMASDGEYEALIGRFSAAWPRWEEELTRMAEYLTFRHWPKAVNDDGLYPRVALTAGACVGLYHLVLLGWRDQPEAFSQGDVALLWAAFSRETEHLEENFFTLAEVLSDREEWPLAAILAR